jgi:hypothetical protein
MHPAVAASSDAFMVSPEYFDSIIRLPLHLVGFACGSPARFCRARNQEHVRFAAATVAMQEL